MKWNRTLDLRKIVRALRTYPVTVLIIAFQLLMVIATILLVLGHTFWASIVGEYGFVILAVAVTLTTINLPAILTRLLGRNLREDATTATR